MVSGVDSFFKESKAFSAFSSSKDPIIALIITTIIIMAASVYSFK